LPGRRCNKLGLSGAVFSPLPEKGPFVNVAFLSRWRILSTSQLQASVPPPNLRHENVSQNCERDKLASKMRTIISIPALPGFPFFCMLCTTHLASSFPFLLASISQKTRLRKTQWITSRLQPRPCYLLLSATRQSVTARKNGIGIGLLSRVCIH
jgi:hypothetical protein